MAVGEVAIARFKHLRIFLWSRCTQEYEYWIKWALEGKRWDRKPFSLYSLLGIWTSNLLVNSERERPSERETERMDAYAAHLAMAALVGASIVAVSAYFMHRKTLAQILEFAREGRVFEEEGFSDGNKEDLVLDKRRRRNRQRLSNKNVEEAAVDGGIFSSGASNLAEDLRSLHNIPPGLPRLQTLPEGILEFCFFNLVRENGGTLFLLLFLLSSELRKIACISFF